MSLFSTWNIWILLTSEMPFTYFLSSLKICCLSTFSKQSWLQTKFKKFEEFLYFFLAFKTTSPRQIDKKRSKKKVNFKKLKEV